MTARARCSFGAGRAAAIPAGPRSVASPLPIRTPRRGAATASTSWCVAPTGRCGIALASTAAGRTGPRSAVRRSDRRRIVASAPGRVDVFVRGRTTRSTRSGGTARQWHGWASLGGGLTFSPDAVSYGPGELDVYARGQDGALWQTWQSGGAWHGWARIGGDPHVVTWCGNARSGTGRRVRQGR